ncbi:Dehydrogenasesshort chain protein 30, partial [Aphelenchoides avenae]
HLALHPGTAQPREAEPKGPDRAHHRRQHGPRPGARRGVLQAGREGDPHGAQHRQAAAGLLGAGEDGCREKVEQPAPAGVPLPGPRGAQRRRRQRTDQRPPRAVHRREDHRRTCQLRRAEQPGLVSRDAALRPAEGDGRELLRARRRDARAARLDPGRRCDRHDRQPAGT